MVSSRHSANEQQEALPPPPCPRYGLVRKKSGPNRGCILNMGVPWTRGGGGTYEPGKNQQMVAGSNKRHRCLAAGVIAQVVDGLRKTISWYHGVQRNLIKCIITW